MLDEPICGLNDIERAADIPNVGCAARASRSERFLRACPPPVPQRPTCVAHRPDMASGADRIVRVFRTVQSAADTPRLLADAKKDVSAAPA
jgi:hypothetical protein